MTTLNPFSIITIPNCSLPQNSKNTVSHNLFKVSQFLKTLESDLERGVGSRLDSLLGQCMYFGLSFSRVGADFRGLLPPLFKAAAIKGFTDALDAATVRFEETMRSYTLHPVPSMLTATVMSSTSGKVKNISVIPHKPYIQDVGCSF